MLILTIHTDNCQANSLSPKREWKNRSGFLDYIILSAGSLGNNFLNVPPESKLESLFMSRKNINGTMFSMMNFLDIFFIN